MRKLLKQSILIIPMLIGVASIALTSCKKEKPEYSITIASPTNNSTVTNAASVSIEVTFTTNDELHEYDISLKQDTVGAMDIAPFPLHGHEHEGSITITEAINLSSYPSGTRFIIAAETCADHDCEEKVTSTSSFLIP